MMTKKSWGLAQERWIYTANDERLGRGFLDEWDWTVRDLNGRVLSEFESRLDSLGSSSSWLWNGDYYYNEGKLSAASRPGEIGRYRYYHLDHLGTPRLLTDSRAYRLAEHEYYPFGLEQTSWAQEIETYGHARIDDLKFTSHERDFLDPRSTWTQEYLDYMHARHYNPKWGRFLSVDPILEVKAAVANPQLWNRYAYVRNNPLMRIDPDGRRDIYVAVWNAKFPFIFGSGSVGHVAAFELSGKVIVSQFPAPHGMNGRNDTKTFNETLAVEGRGPDKVFKVFVPNDQAFDEAAASQRSPQTKAWDWNPNPAKSETQCSVAVATALDAGGVDVPNWQLSGTVLPADIRITLNLSARSTAMNIRPQPNQPRTVEVPPATIPCPGSPGCDQR